MRVAIVTPAYNVGKYIAETIESVIAQSHADWAMVVVDDGSTDDTSAAVKNFSDNRIRLVRQANAGVSAARNRGLSELDADAVLLLDADDLLAPDALSRLVAALEATPDAVAACGTHAYISEDGARQTHSGSRLPASGDLLGALLERNLFANGGQVLVRARVVAELGGFRSDIAYGEDWEYWVRLAFAGSFTVVTDRAPILLVRQRKAGAYLQLGSDPSAFVACMDAIFSNHGLVERFGPDAVNQARRRAEAENAWIIGREHIRHGRHVDGRHWLRRSVLAKPNARRIALLAQAHLVTILPEWLQSPFQAYAAE